MASAMTEVFPRIWNPQSAGKDNGEYEFTWTTGSVIGTVYSEFRTAEGGDLIDYDQAAWGRVYTEDGAPLAITLVDGGIPWLLAFDIEADIDQAGGTRRPPMATASLDGRRLHGRVHDHRTWSSRRAYGDYPAAGVIELHQRGRDRDRHLRWRQHGDLQRSGGETCHGGPWRTARSASRSSQHAAHDLR